MKSTNSGFARLVLCASISVVLAACGGGGSSGDAAGNSGTSSTSGNGSTGTVAASSMSGTVAIGDPLVGAPITIIDVNGKTATTTSGANGAYSVSIAGLTAPFAITATNATGASGDLYSVVPSTATTNGAPVTANVTPLTTAVSALLTTSGNPLTVTQAGGLSGVTVPTVAAAVTTLNTALAPILTSNGLSAASFDPIGGAFTPNQTGADAVIDSVSVRPSPTGGGLQIASLADPNTSIQLQQGATASAVLQTPTQPANYLAPLLAQLRQCMAGPADGSAPACASAFDSHYLNDGSSQFRYSLSLWFIGNGTTLTGAKTIAFLPSGTLPGVNNPAALVNLLFTEQDGTPNSATEIVQRLPGGNWDFIGNQVQIPQISIASFIGRVQFTKATEVSNGRYESGLNIEVPATASTPTGSYTVSSALVTGPGLPESGVRMMHALGPQGNHFLTFPLNALAGTPVSVAANGFSWPDSGMSMQYKWSWAPLSGGTLLFTPSTPDYAPQPVNVSTIKPYGVYTVTLFDSSGNMIGVPQQVINIAPNANAATGAMVPWQTLGSDVIPNLLTAGGVGTSAGTATSSTGTTVDWTVPTTSLVYPKGWAALNAEHRAVALPDSLPYPASSVDLMLFLTTAQSTTTHTITISGYTPHFTPMPPYSNGDSAAQVQLGWQADGEMYTNTWQYDN